MGGGRGALGVGVVREVSGVFGVVGEVVVW